MVLIESMSDSLPNLQEQHAKCAFVFLSVLLVCQWRSYCVDFLNRVKKKFAASPFLKHFSARQHNAFFCFCQKYQLSSSCVFRDICASSAKKQTPTRPYFIVRKQSKCIHFLKVEVFSPVTLHSI